MSAPASSAEVADEHRRAAAVAVIVVAAAAPSSLYPDVGGASSEKTKGY